MGILNYTTIDRIFSKLHRELKNTELNETDVIEWIGEALEFLKVPQILVQDVKFLTVKNNHVDIPSNLHAITQIAKNVNITSFDNDCEKYEDEEESIPDPCNRELLDLDWTYQAWTSSEYYYSNYTPVRLVNNTFFNSLVCKEKDQSLYSSCIDEYTIVGDVEKKIRFSFEKGIVAISYLKNAVSKETGYPLIPDNIYYITAISYYLKWKITEMYENMGRQGYAEKAEKNRKLWDSYVKKAKNNMKMPKTLDQYQNLLEATHNFIPNHKRYYNYFGYLGRAKSRQFNNLGRV